MFPYNNNYNMPYGYNPMQAQQTTQTIQQINPQAQKQAACYFVNSADDLASAGVASPNVYYLGINTEKGEIYTRRMNNDGNIEAETYIKAAAKKEKTELQKVMDRLDEIEKKLTKGNGYVATVNVADE